MVSAYSVTSRPFCTEIRFTAFAMLATAICRKPSATCSGVRSSPVLRAMAAVRPANRRRTTSVSSGWSPAGPKTWGKVAGWIRPSITLASVTVSGPPLR